MMKKLILILALSFSFHTLCAQQKGRKFDNEKFKAELYQYLTNQASLTSQEAAAFFPLYEEMLVKQRALFVKKKKSCKTKPADEKGCRQLILNMDKLEIEMKEIQAQYHKKFLHVMPASKLYDVLKAEENFHRQAFKRVAHRRR